MEFSTLHPHPWGPRESSSGLAAGLVSSDSLVFGEGCGLWKEDGGKTRMVIAKVGPRGNENASRGSSERERLVSGSSSHT